MKYLRYSVGYDDANYGKDALQSFLRMVPSIYCSEAELMKDMFLLEEMINTSHIYGCAGF